MEYPQRKHARYRWHDYNGGLYFITICVKDKKHLFGRIENHQITFTEIGEIAACHVQEIPLHWNGVKVISSVVMPNYVHLIIHIDGQRISQEHSFAATPRRGPTLGGLHSVLAAVIGGYKSGVTRYANSRGIEFGWQNGFHDHIIKDNDSYEKIMDYIVNNVYKWSDDCYFS